MSFPLPRISTEKLPNPYRWRALDAIPDCPPLAVMAFLMWSCGVNRLYEKDDVRELLVRMQFLYNEKGIPERFFENEDILIFEHEEMEERSLSFDDLIAFLGLEVEGDERKRNKVGRRSWYRKRGRYWERANMNAWIVWSDFPFVLFPAWYKELEETHSEEWEEQERRIVEREVSDEEAEKAEEFADVLIDRIGKRPFLELELRCKVHLMKE